MSRKILGLSKRNWKCFIVGNVIGWAVALYALACRAGVPVEFTVETSRADVHEQPCYHGETLDFDVTFKSYGKDLMLPTNAQANIFWQTNGMSAFFWRTNNVTVVSNKMYSTFTPAMDPGTGSCFGFLGIPGVNYRASFVLRFKNSPGAEPREMEWPYRDLDFNKITVVNAPYFTKAETYSKEGIIETAYEQAKLAITNEVIGSLTNKEEKLKSGNGIRIRSEIEAYGFSFEYAIGDEMYGYTKQLPGENSDNKDLYEDVKFEKRLQRGEYFAFVVMRDGSGYKVEGYGESLFTGAAVRRNERDVEGISRTVSVSESLTNGFVNASITNGILSTVEKDYRRKDDNVCIKETLSEWELTGDYEIKWNDNEGWRLWSYGTPVSNPKGGYNAIYLKWNENEVLTRETIEAKRERVCSSNDVFVTWANVKRGTSEIVVLTNGEARTKSGLAVTAQNVGAYPNASGQMLSAQVATQGAHLNAEDAQCVVTNYDSVTHLREMKLRIKLQEGGTNVWREIWDEMDRWNAFTGTNFNWQSWIGIGAWIRNIEAALGLASPKEYAFYDGVTGDVAPDGFFWISQPRIGICAGAGYQRYLDAGAAVWILESNGMCANVGGTTNGYFRISDEEGNVHFEIVKGDKETVPAISRSVTCTNVMGVTHWYSVYAVTNAISPPVAKFCRDLAAQTWIADTEASCPCNVVWTPGVNTYTLEFWPKASEPKMFCKAEYDKGGETKIRQTVPTEMQYIILNDTKYGLVPKTVNGELVMGLTTGGQ